MQNFMHTHNARELELHRKQLLFRRSDLQKCDTLLFEFYKCKKLVQFAKPLELGGQ